MGQFSDKNVRGEFPLTHRPNMPQDHTLPKTETRTNPFNEHLKLPPIEITDGVARLEFTIDEIHLRHGGVLHGGMYATILDTVCGYTAYGVAPPGADLVTVQLNLNLTATGKLGDRVVVTAEVVHAGRRTAVVRGDIRRTDGKLLGTGTVTFFFMHEGLTK